MLAPRYSSSCRQSLSSVNVTLQKRAQALHLPQSICSLCKPYLQQHHMRMVTALQLHIAVSLHRTQGMMQMCWLGISKQLQTAWHMRPGL